MKYEESEMIKDP